MFVYHILICFIFGTHSRLGFWVSGPWYTTSTLDTSDMIKEPNIISDAVYTGCDTTNASFFMGVDMVLETPGVDPIGLIHNPSL